MPALKPIYLRPVVRGRLRGLNNGEIAEKYGINRNTVNKYVTALKEIPITDLLRIAGESE